MHKFFFALLVTVSFGQDPQIVAETSASATPIFLQVNQGDGSNWQLQVSTDLDTWSSSALPEGTNWAYAPGSASTVLFFRAHRESSASVKDLYDLGTYRVMQLDFPQPDWIAQLTANYDSGTNLSASLTVDGVTYPGVGARYKGDTSYRLATTTKKSFGIEIDDTDPELRLLDYKSLNLNNAFTDASFMREVLYNNFCRQYVPSPKSNFIHLFVNGVDYGVYVNAQQQNGDFLNEVFQDNDGDRWRAGLVPGSINGGGPGGGGGGPGGGGGGPGGGGGGGGGTTLLNFGGDLSWLGSDTNLYETGYILKTDKNPDPWPALVTAIDALNNTAIADLPAALEPVMAVDRFLWLLALENLFLDSDGYLAKAGDYLLYHDINTGRIHPIQHDGNETFNADATEIPDGVSTEPFYGENLAVERPLTARLFAIDAYRQRYLAHMRTILNESFNWAYFETRIAAYAPLIQADVLADTTKQTSNADFLSSIDSTASDLRAFIEARRSFLLSHSDIAQLSPSYVSGGLLNSAEPVAGSPATMQAVLGASPALASVTLYYTSIQDGAYTATLMTLMADGSYQGQVPGMLAGTTVYYYFEAQASDAVGTVAYLPAHAEGAPMSYQVGLTQAASTQIVINEIMAKNDTALADQDGEFDDWIELANLSNLAVDLSGYYLSDNETNPRKWAIPTGTIIPANGYLLIWADEDGSQAGLHANFKLASGGETITLVDSDANGNLLLDTLAYGELGADVSFGRSGDGSGTLGVLTPSPGVGN